MDKIGRHVYAQLKSMNPKNLTDEQLEQVSSYESVSEISEEAKKRTSQYWEKVCEDENGVEPELTLSEVNELFMEKFKELEGKEFDRNRESLSALECLITYLLGLSVFFDCSPITKLSEPNLKKGLLVIGDFGNGKTSMFKVLQSVLLNTKMKFGIYSANQIVDMYEACSTQGDKDYFWRRMVKDRILFDDVKTERIANNYGKANLFKDILEKRYALGVTTFITCNYDDNHPQDIKKAVEEFGTKYGGRVYDRLFEMFNILEFRGKSFRK